MPWQPDPADRARRERMARSACQGEAIEPRVFQAMVRAPREAFVPGELRDVAFEDRALDIGHGQTISAPHMVAIMCSVLDPLPGDRVLEVGTGSGYHAAVLAELVKPDGNVVSIEVVAALAERARTVLHDIGYRDWIDVRVGDGAAGAPDAGPFDRISMAAATPAVPDALFEQLAAGGRLVAPIGTRECVLTAFDKTADGIRRSEHGLCVFVPLTGPHGVGRTSGRAGHPG